MTFVEIFLTPGLVWPAIHAVTGGYVGHLYGLPAPGAILGAVVGIVTSMKICKAGKFTFTDSLASGLTVLILMGSPYLAPPVMLLLLVFTSSLPLIRAFIQEGANEGSEQR